MSIDRVREAWRESPSQGTAASYLLTTLQYVSDEMLSDESLYAAVEEVGQWLVSLDDAEFFGQEADVEFGNWRIDLDSPERLYIRHKDHPGDISVKADDEGYVVDIYPDGESECDATTYSFYNDLKCPDEED